MTDSLSNDVSAIEDRATPAIADARSVDALRALQAEVLGRRGSLTALNSTVGRLAPEDRKKAGALVNEARERLETAFSARSAELVTRRSADRTTCASPFAALFVSATPLRVRGRRSSSGHRAGSRTSAGPCRTAMTRTAFERAGLRATGP